MLCTCIKRVHPKAAGGQRAEASYGLRFALLLPLLTTTTTTTTTLLPLPFCYLAQNLYYVALPFLSSFLHILPFPPAPLSSDCLLPSYANATCIAQYIQV